MASCEVKDLRSLTSTFLKEDKRTDLSGSKTDSENPGIVEVTNKSHEFQYNVLCRDYVRGFCPRANCRFAHDLNKNPGVVKFCHDYQNKGCLRNNCMYFHCTIEEEEEFRKTGKLNVFNNNPSENPHKMTTRENMPPLPLPQHQFYLPPLDRPPPPTRPAYPGPPLPPPPPGYFPQSMGPPPNMEDYYVSAIHRPPLQPRNEEHSQGYYGEPTIGDKKRKCPEDDVRECEQCLLKDKENSSLQEQLNQALRKNAQLEKENDKLKSANEFLLDQTATLRGYTKQVTLVNANNTQSVMSPQILRSVGMTLTTSQDQLIGSVSSNAAPQQILVTTSPRTQILEVTPSPQFLSAATSQQEILGTSSHSQLLGVNASQAQLLGVNSSQPSQILGVNVSQPQFIGVSAPQQIIVTNAGQGQLIAVGSTQQTASAQQQISNIAANINGQLLSSTRQIISSNREQRQIINTNPDQLLQTVVIASQGQALVQPSLNPQLQIVTASPAENTQGLPTSSTPSVVSYPVSQTLLHQ